MNRIRTTMSVSTAAIAVCAALVGPAQAAPAAAPAPAAGCKTILTGGLVGNEMIGSSGDVYAQAAAERQPVVIDDVTVNYAGQTRYRLGSSVKLVVMQPPVPTTFVGGKGYFVSGNQLVLDRSFTRCVRGLR